MKRLIIIFIFSSLAPVFSLAQSCKEPFLGSKTLYTSQQNKYRPAPKGYQPVFINHVGRHGARHLTKKVNSYYLYSVLLQADTADGLSANGKLLKEKVLRLEKSEANLYKSISNRGVTEQQGLADRMYANNSNFFKTANPVIHVEYTKEIRTMQTSNAFLAELEIHINKPAVTKEINDTILRFYDMSPAYTGFEETGDWLTSVQQLKDSLKYYELAKQISQQFFTLSFFKNLTKKNQDKFTSDLFGFICIFYSLQKEITDAGFNTDDVDMRPFLTCTQLVALAKIDNAEDYFVKGPGSNVNGIQVKIAMPLLADFINTTDDYIKTKSINTQLRFSHAETISPFAALLAFTGSSEQSKNLTAIDETWRADKIIPLSSNIQWILYKKPGSENYLVKFLLNEKEVAVNGLFTKTFPYYSWTDVRQFYLKKMAEFNASLNTDYVEYLKEIK